ncbi:tetratricopeptide repeat protein [Hydrogenimonas sp.]
MKIGRLTVALCTLLLALHGADPQTAATQARAEGTHAVDPEARRVLERAEKMILAKQWLRAYRFLSKRWIDFLEYPEIQYLYGRAAFETGHYEEALEAYERVLILRPRDLLAELETGRTYFAMESFPAARKIFYRLLERPDLPYSTYKKIQSYLDVMANYEKRTFFHATLAAAVGYDSNLYNRARYDRFFLPAYQIQVDNTVRNVSDTYHQETADATYLHDFGEMGGFAFRLEGSLYLQTMTRYSDSNIFYLNAAPALLYTHGPWLYDFTVGFDRMLYGSDPYLHTLYLKPSFRYAPDKRGYYRLYGVLQRKWADGELYRGRDANYGMLTFELYREVTDSLWLKPSLSVMRERKIDSFLTDVDHDALMVRLEGEWRFLPRYSLGVEARYKGLRYRETDAFFLSRRKDTYLEGDLILARQFEKRWRLEATFGYIDNRSNIQFYRYDKYFATLGVVKEF